MAYCASCSSAVRPAAAQFRSTQVPGTSVLNLQLLGVCKIRAMHRVVPTEDEVHGCYPVQNGLFLVRERLTHCEPLELPVVSDTALLAQQVDELSARDSNRYIPPPRAVQRTLCHPVRLSSVAYAYQPKAQTRTCACDEALETGGLEACCWSFGEEGRKQDIGVSGKRAHANWTEHEMDVDPALLSTHYWAWDRGLVGSFLPRVRAYSIPAVRDFFRLTERDWTIFSDCTRAVARQMWRMRSKDILDKVPGYDIARLQAPNRSYQGYPQYHGRILNDKPFGEGSIASVDDIKYRRLVYAFEFWELALECAALSVTVFETALYPEDGPLRVPELDERMWLAWCQLQHQWTASKLFEKDTGGQALPYGRRKYRWAEPPVFALDAYAVHTCLQEYGGVDHLVQSEVVQQRLVPADRLPGGDSRDRGPTIFVATPPQSSPQTPEHRHLRASLRTQASASILSEPEDLIQAVISSTADDE
ncbi:hypothetical protein FVE85_0047 [Porphyridium purpureum]|uniref:Uncharacterized protein n=1 Tax=Porphyridium purpureum TaxID=35688 RepID=A0A5J4YYX5_PORPP|nr:hypothetical protein FVE85_0047 [Porphyridium purpureum]|eukprot:POR0582..scf208_2